MTLQEWIKRAEAKLVGKRIVGVRYMTDAEAHAAGWIIRPLVLTLDSGWEVFPVADDEGNNGGVLWCAKGDLDVAFPAMWVTGG